MSMNEFEKEVLDRFNRIETDIAYIKGELSGRNHKTSNTHSRFVLWISVGALVVAVASVFIRIIK